MKSLVNKLAITVFLISWATKSHAQTDSATEKIYHVNIKWELPAATAGLVFFSAVGLPKIIEHATLSEADLAKLDPYKVNRFDRPVIFNQKARSNAISSSDIFLNSSIVSPILLALDKQIRKDWFPLLGMYLVTHAVNNTIFLGAVSTVRRVRPLAYNAELPVEERSGEGRTNSFYSGHVSNAAASTFFIAKVFTDYHHIRGWKRIGIYTIAAVPPIMVGHFRLQAGRHFQSDVIVGFLVGATTGIVVPELHRVKKKANLTMSPVYSSDGLGVAVRYKF